MTSLPNDIAEGPFERFAEELDALIDRWRVKPADDRLSAGQVVGALTFAAFNIMRVAQDDAARETGP